MKLTLSSTELLKRLQFLSGVINSSNTMPILDNFLFEAENNILKITASDLETTMSTTIDIVFDGKISIALPAKILLEVMKTFTEQPLVFTFGDSGTIEIKSNTGEYEIACYPADEYPKPIVLENPTATSLPSKVLVSALTKTLFAAGNDELRPVMSGILFQMSPEGLIFVATDAHKLVKYSRTDVKSSESVDFIMPKKPLGILKTILATVDQDVVVEYNNTNACFSFGTYIISCRLIDGKYPNYEAVIPKDNPNKLIIDRASFLNSVKRIAVFSNKTTHQVRLKTAGKELNISTEDMDFSSKGDERLTCNYEGENMQIGFNSRFLTEMLGIIQSDEIQLEMSTEKRAGILTPVDGQEDGEQLLMLVMPVLLNQ